MEIISNRVRSANPAKAQSSISSETQSAVRNENGEEGEAGRRGAYREVRERRAASLTKPDEVYHRTRTSTNS